MTKLAYKKVSRSTMGVTMIELVIALVVLLVGLLPTISLIVNMRKGMENREEAVTAAMLAQNLIEQIRSKKWDEFTPTPAAFITNRSNTLGADSGETTTSQYDDIDDFNGMTDHPEPRISRTVVVNYVNLANGGSTTDSTTGPTDFKKIKVTVSWTSGSKIQNQTIETILTNTN